MAARPVEIEAEPAADGEPRAVEDDRGHAVDPCPGIDDIGIVLGNVDILRLSRVDGDRVSLDAHLLLVVAVEAALVPRLPPEPLDRLRYVVRLVEKGVANIGGPVGIVGHQLKDVAVVGYGLDGLVPVPPVNARNGPSPFKPRLGFLNLRRVGCGREHDGQKRVRIEGNGRQELIEVRIGEEERIGIGRTGGRRENAQKNEKENGCPYGLFHIVRQPCEDRNEIVTIAPVFI
jgi:hypothetical protein